MANDQTSNGCDCANETCVDIRTVAIQPYWACVRNAHVISSPSDLLHTYPALAGMCFVLLFKNKKQFDVCRWINSKCPWLWQLLRSALRCQYPLCKLQVCLKACTYTHSHVLAWLQSSGVLQIPCIGWRQLKVSTLYGLANQHGLDVLISRRPEQQTKSLQSS